ncbi:hypothetical protein TWF481_012078 [Arthrobotrys musiformis]|uniref:Uncharacterized protein n=1 Tax=Arthrobotrys musiformis TaxID=47236 RepID=A0AAV9VXY7_9PEZI
MADLASSIISKLDTITAFLALPDCITNKTDYLSLDSICSSDAEKIRDCLVNDPVLESPSARFTYDAEFQQIRVTRANAVINITAGWLQLQQKAWMKAKILPEAYENDITAFCGVEFRNFASTTHSSTIKTPNYCMMPWTSIFPSLVVETGYTQPATDLERDKEIWKTATNGETKIVIITKFSPTPRNTVMGVIGFHRINGVGGVNTCSKYTIFPPPVTKTEQSYHISLGEVYSGTCPEGIDADTELTLSISELRDISRVVLVGCGLVPD